MNTENNQNQKNENINDDEISWGGCLVTFAVIGLIAWALIHFNPSEDKHREAVSEVIAEMVMDGQIPSLSSTKALTNMKYHSIGILSWTSTRYHGKTKLVTAGMLGYVYPFFEY